MSTLVYPDMLIPKPPEEEKTGAGRGKGGGFLEDKAFHLLLPPLGTSWSHHRHHPQLQPKKKKISSSSFRLYNTIFPSPKSNHCLIPRPPLPPPLHVSFFLRFGPNSFTTHTSLPPPQNSSSLLSDIHLEALIAKLGFSSLSFLLLLLLLLSSCQSEDDGLSNLLESGGGGVKIRDVKQWWFF